MPESSELSPLRGSELNYRGLQSRSLSLSRRFEELPIQRYSIHIDVLDTAE